MNLEFLRTLALTGGEWVLWALILMFVVTLVIIGERYWVLRAERDSLNLLTSYAVKLIEGDDFAEAATRARKINCVSSRILMAALQHAQTGVASMQERVSMARTKGRHTLNKNILFLGTLGSNAPFIGLFGTVLGVIKAFHDLAGATEGADAAMSGLSEALIATAVGLVVAIPALMAFNFLQKRADDILIDTDNLIHLVTARVTADRRDGPGGER